MTNSIVKLETTRGSITIELDDETTPETVRNFLSYVRDGFYDGTVFHRVIKGFMIQGGGFNENMVQKDTGEPIPNEADKGRANDRGTLAMARTQDPDSATSQFFINHKDNGFLNHTAPSIQGWGYCAFGHVTDGMDVVDAIADAPTGNQGPHADVPTESIVITSASVVQD